MKTKLVCLGALAGALAIPMVAQAGSSTDRATGGGQVLVSDDGGAGDTIAFTARGTAEAAKGEVQYVDRTGGTGQGQTTYHGDVQCLAVDGNRAKLSGTWRDGGNFQLIVIDNGEGAGDENDVVIVQKMDDFNCSDEDDDDDDGQTALSRGNAQVYDASASRSGKRAKKGTKVAPTLTYTKAISMAGLR